MIDLAWLEPKTNQEVDGILSELRRRLERLYGERLRGLRLFGPYARGDAPEGSDVEVLVILDRLDSHWDEIQRTSEDNAAISLAHDLTLSTLFTTEDRWRAADTDFLRRVHEEGRAA